MGTLVIGLSASAASREWPAADWKTATPESQEVDVGPLDELHRAIESGKHGYVTSMRVYRHGFQVYEKAYKYDFDKAAAGRDHPKGQYNYYDADWHPMFERGNLQSIQSISKSVTSALVGIAIGRGELPGVDIDVLSYFKGFETDGDPRQAAITLRDLLTMTAGIEWDESSTDYTDPANSAAAMEGSDDWVQYVLQLPMRSNPGEAFEYNSGITVLIGHILSQATGKSVDAYAEEFLFGPLGIKEYFWKKAPGDVTDTEGGLYLKPADLARFGYLYLNDGIWNGKRILPEGWVAATMQPSTDVPDWVAKYGYQWWLLPYKGKEPGWAYTGLGYGGQHLLVVPEYDLVAVFTGWNIYDLPSLESTLSLDHVLRSVQ